MGKSSLINSLKRDRVAGVGKTAGFTKTVQEVRLDKHIRLLDSPGVLMGLGEKDQDDDAMFLRNCLSVEKIKDPMGAGMPCFQLLIVLSVQLDGRRHALFPTANCVVCSVRWAQACLVSNC